MQRGFGGPVFEPVQEPIQQRREREVTLGTASLLVLGFGLFGLCALCFGFGYAAGHSHSADAAVVTGAGIESGLAQAQNATLPTKPAAGQSGVQSQPPAASDPGTAEADAPAEPAANDAAIAVPVPAVQTRTESSPSPSESVIRTALPTQASTGVSATAAGRVVPALTQTAGVQSAGIMVQIAAVSHPEDADVLVTALRKHGYAVSARRDPADGLLHVQVGPFASRSDAAIMRQRLLNDGYNAVLQ